MRHLLPIPIFILFLLPFAKGQELYFPPLSQSAIWETISPDSLGWCTENIQPLYDYLADENSKAFIVLKDGRIVLEKYFDAFTRDSFWYWASAGKTITALLIGKAQEEGFLSIQDMSSTYLGDGWTSCSAEEENKITIWNQLTMTSGLDDGVPDNHCTEPLCLVCLAEPGTRWAYHNAPYTLLEGVITSATGQAINTYTQTRLKNLTGMNGFWLTVDNDNVYFSTPRSMARFGLLMQNNAVWNTTPILQDTAYVGQMLRTSQSLNLSYGYLWWLNGKPSFMLPSVQFVFPGSYAPHAPADMYAGIGKNGQIVSIAKSKGLVVVRMGNATDNGEVSTLLVDRIWEKLNDVVCTSTATNDLSVQDNALVYPNPASDVIYINTGEEIVERVDIYDVWGRKVLYEKTARTLRVDGLHPGLYFAVIQFGDGRQKVTSFLRL